MLLSRCAETGDALSCAAIRRAPSGIVTAIIGLLHNTGGIRTKGIDATLTIALRRDRRRPASASTSRATTCSNMPSARRRPTASPRPITSAPSAAPPIRPIPTSRGRRTIDWTLGPVTASVTGRYIDNVAGDRGGERAEEPPVRRCAAAFRPSWLDAKFAFTFGVNNVFDKDPPACFSCSLNNFDPTTYDVPGRFGYLRLSYGL